MSIAIMALLGITVCLAVALALVNLAQARRERQVPKAGRNAPAFFDHSARETDDGAGTEQPGSRSQFAWQSRSHSQRPD